MKIQKYKTLQLRYFRNIHVYGHTPDSSVHTNEHTHVYTGLLLGLVYTFARYILLFKRSEGHGSGYKTARSGMLVLSNTARLPVQWQYTKPVQINSWTNSKTVPTSKIKSQCVGNTQRRHSNSLNTPSTWTRSDGWLIRKSNYLNSRQSHHKIYRIWVYIYIFIYLRYLIEMVYRSK